MRPQASLAPRHCGFGLRSWQLGQVFGREPLALWPPAWSFCRSWKSLACITFVYSCITRYNKTLPDARAFLINSLAMPIEDPKIKARDLPPTAVRLPPELKHQLSREAEIHQRTLHAEILIRLRASLEPPAVNGARSAQQATMRAHSDLETSALELFRRMTPDRQLALLTLLKPWK